RSLAGGNGQLSESSWSGAPGIPDAPLQLFGRRGGCPALGRAGRFRSPKAGGELSCQPRTGRSRQPAPRVGTGGEKSAGAAKPPPHRRCTLLASYSLSCSGRVVPVGLVVVETSALPSASASPPASWPSWPRLTADSSTWATSTTSTDSEAAFSFCREVSPSVSITRQNGQPVAIFVGAVPSASSTRSRLMRLPMRSSIHIRAPPAPQHIDRSACRGISRRLAPEAPTSSRGGVYTLLCRPR